MSYDISTHLNMGAKGADKAALMPKPQMAEKAAVEGKVSTSETTGFKWKGDKIETPDTGDVAILSSSVSISHAENNPSVSIFGMPLSRKTVDTLKELYQKAYRASHSHNLMLERFMQNMAANALVLVLSNLGVSAKEMDNLQASVRGEAIKEIESKIASDWAYAKAMTDIVG